MQFKKSTIFIPRRCENGLACYGLGQNCRKSHPTQSQEQRDQLISIFNLEEKSKLLMMIVSTNKTWRANIFGYKNIQHMLTIPKQKYKNLDRNKYYLCSASIKSMMKAQIELSAFQRIQDQHHIVQNVISLINKTKTHETIKYSPSTCQGQVKIGKCIVKQGMKYIKTQNGQYFCLNQRVNQKYENIKYPFVHGVKVEYKEIINGNNEKQLVYGQIKYPKSSSISNIKLFGKLTVIKGEPGIRFIPSDPKMDTMIVFNVFRLKEWRFRTLSYSFFMNQIDFKTDIENLQNWHVLGKCIDWPTNMSAPLIQLEGGVFKNNFSNLKLSIYQIYSLNQNHTQKAESEAQKICNSWQTKKKEFYKNRKNITDQDLFTIDSKDCHRYDDAFSIKLAPINHKHINNLQFFPKIQDHQKDKTLEKITNKKKSNFSAYETESTTDMSVSPSKHLKIPSNKATYTIGIHIIDIDEHIKLQPDFDQYIQQRSQSYFTINHGIHMFPKNLIKLFSLVKDQQRLALSLFFNMDQDGSIDYSTIKLEETIIKVKKNYTHSDFGQLLSVKRLQLMLALEKLFKNRQRFRKNVQSKKHRVQNLVQNIKFCANELLTYLLNTNLKIVMDYQKTVESRLSNLNFTEIIIQKQLFIENLQKQKLNIMAELEQSMQIKLQDKIIPNLQNPQINRNSKSNLLSSNPIKSILISSLDIKKYFSQYQSLEFNEFEFCQDPIVKKKYSSLKSGIFLKQLFQQCGQQFKMNSIAQIQQSFQKLISSPKKYTYLFRSYIEKIRNQNRKNFTDYFNNPALRALLNAKPETFMHMQNTNIQALGEQQKKQLTKQINLDDWRTQHGNSQESFNRKKQYFLQKVHSINNNNSNSQKLPEQTVVAFQKIIQQINNQIQIWKKQLEEMVKKEEKRMKLVGFLEKINFLESYSSNENTKTSVMLSQVPQMIKDLTGVEFLAQKESKQRQNQLSVAKHQICWNHKKLHWSTPIRKYSCILGQRLIKNNKHLFTAELDLVKIIEKFKPKMNQFFKDWNFMQKYSLESNDQSNMSEKIKNAFSDSRKISYIKNRQVPILQLEDQFLIIKEFQTNKVLVYHEVLKELELIETYTGTQFYKVKKGKFVFSLFPLIIKVRLLQNQ